MIPKMKISRRIYHKGDPEWVDKILKNMPSGEGKELEVFRDPHDTIAIQYVDQKKRGYQVLAIWAVPVGQELDDELCKRTYESWKKSRKKQRRKSGQAKP